MVILTSPSRDLLSGGPIALLYPDLGRGVHLKAHERDK